MLFSGSKILVIDEATANLDSETDGKIKSLFNRLKNKCTFIMIAHRVKNLIDFDKILVLDKGSVIEYDSPSNLLNKHDSLFYEIYNSSSH